MQLKKKTSGDQGLQFYKFLPESLNAMIILNVHYWMKIQKNYIN